jgi:N-acetylneuraminate synthase/N,N'-diacetyllegionaminate synthase
MTTLPVGDKTIAPNAPALVIAEIGVNHDGSVDRALELTEAAAECGADAVKLQIFRAKALMHTSSAFAEYQKDRVAAPNPVEMLQKYELSDAEIDRVVRRIRELKMLPLATPFSLADVDAIRRLDLPAIKIASPDLVNRPLLERASRLGKPLLISTGAATLDEVRTTVQWMREWQREFALLHCVSAYPVPADQANLCWISELSEEFAAPVGYSDHTTSLLSGALAVAAGACVLERHLTYDRTAPGPDHSASSDPRQFKQYVDLVREAQVLRGVPGKTVLPVEHDVRSVSRQSLVVARTLAKGAVIAVDDLIVQRPGTGIPAAMIVRAVGRKVVRPIPSGSLLQWDMLSDAA